MVLRLPFHGVQSTITHGVISAVVILLCLASRASADITIKFDDLKDGDKISDVTPVIVRADSGDGIDKVEFAVDDQLRFSTGSTPYTFKWDTIPDTEGAHNLAVTAIDANGVKKTVKLNLNIDNELALGAPALARKAREALAAKDTATAAKYSRRALKAEPDNIDASRAFAAIEADKLNWDRAISSLEKAKNLDSSPEALTELASYRMHRSVLPENTANLVADIETAGDLRRKAANLELDRVKAKNLPGDQPSSHEILGDSYFNAARYPDAVQEYSKSASSGAITSTNRLGLAYVMNDQAQEATVLLRSVIKDKSGDAASHAVMGLALLRLRRFAEAKDAVRPVLGNGNPACLIVAAYADAVLGKLETAAQEAREAVEAAPNAGEAHYALSMSLTKPIESEPEVVKAMALSPFESGPLIDYAIRYAVLPSHTNRFEMSLKLLDVVLKNEPENRSASLAKVLLLFHLGRITEAEMPLAELNRRDPDAADVQVAAGIYFDIKKNPTASEERMKKARALDKDFFDLGTVPDPLGFVYLAVRKLHYRGGFYLTPQTLYPTKATAAAAVQ